MLQSQITQNFQTIIYQKHEGIAYITLNRPDVLNVYNLQMRDDLYQVLNAIKDDEEIKAAIFRGAGERAFCAGADLTEFLSAPSPIIARQVRFWRDLWGLFLSLPQPLIAALHGYVFGSGIEMALCCDIRIASEEAIFGLPETSLGLIPAAGATQTLPRTIGRAEALEMLLTGRRVTAEEAHRFGLVNRVVQRKALLSTVEEIAQKIISYYPLAVKYAKQAVQRGIDMSLEESLKLERQLAEVVLSSEETKDWLSLQR